jgi:hypothetical protein
MARRNNGDGRLEDVFRSLVQAQAALVQPQGSLEQALQR